MKHLVILGLLLFGGFTSFSNDLKREKPLIESIVDKPMKKIDITIKSGAYTIRIRGEVSYGLFSGNITVRGTISIISNGYDLTLPFDYSGPIKKGPNTPKYTVMELENEDFEPVDFIMSRLYIDKNPKNTYFK